MPNPENIEKHEFKKGQSGNPNGRPKGSKNRSTIARKVLELIAIIPDNQFNTLKKLYPEITKQMTAEELATLIQTNKAITKGDTNAYKVLMDSAYGAPVQQVEQTIIEQPLFPDVQEDNRNE